MSNALRDAAESTVHTLSDLVDDARGRIEDLPIHGRRTERSGLWWAIVLSAAGLTAVIVMSLRRSRRSHLRVSTPVPAQKPGDGVGATRTSHLGAA